MAAVIGRRSHGSSSYVASAVFKLQHDIFMTIEWNFISKYFKPSTSSFKPYLEIIPSFDNLIKHRRYHHNNHVFY